MSDLIRTTTNANIILMSHPTTNNNTTPEQYPVRQQEQVSIDLPNGGSITVDIPSSRCCSRWCRCCKTPCQRQFWYIVFILAVLTVGGLLIALIFLVPGTIIGTKRFKTQKYVQHHQPPQPQPTTPVAAPTPTPPTALRPRTGQEIYAIVSLIQSKTLSGQKLRYSTDPITDMTHEEWALQWLIEDDPARLNIASRADEIRLVERYALATLFVHHYDFVDDTLPWTHRTGWMDNSNVCEWYGVTCTKYNLGSPLGIYSPVTSLVLSSNNLVGIVPRDIGLLSYLQEFQINNNDVTGTLPTTIGRWTAMQTFDVSDNSNLMGSIPSSIQNWFDLERITLSNTALTGVVPSNICSADYSIPCGIECSCCTYCYR